MEKVTVEVELSEEFIGDVLVTAFDKNYGACNYWAGVDKVYLSEANEIGMSQADRKWTKVEITDIVKAQGNILEGEDFQEESQYTIDAGTVAEGLRQIVLEKDNYPFAYGYVYIACTQGNAGEIDAPLADMIVQLGLWGEVKYG